MSIKTEALAVYILVLVSLWFSSGHGQAEGDVKIIGPYKGIGRVEIFLKGQWGRVCAQYPSTVTAGRTICTQLDNSRLKDAANVTVMNQKLRNASWPMIPTIDKAAAPFALTGIYCIGTKTHILRCEFFFIISSSSCDNDGDLAVFCSNTTYPNYEGEIRLQNDSISSAGTLEVYKNQTGWGNVCFKNFDKAAADSVCRQCQDASPHCTENSCSDLVHSCSMWE